MVESVQGKMPTVKGLPEPVSARRLKRPSWGDPRFLIGVLLIFSSLVGAGALAYRLDDTVPVLAATRPLTPGDPVRPGDVTVVRARLSQGVDLYADNPALLSGQVVVRAINEGELVARTALGDPTAAKTRPVSVPLSGDGQGLNPGMLVDVWVARRDDKRSDKYFRPQQLGDQMMVKAKESTNGTLGASAVTTVRLAVPENAVAELIEAINNSARITLIPAPAPKSQS